MDSNYWANRVSRRTVLRTSALGGAGLVGSVLIGCTSDEDDPAATGDGAAATTAPSGGGAAATTAPTAPTEVASTGAPERGGIYRLAMVGAPDHYDMHRTTAASTYHVTRWAHSKLMQWTPGNGQFAGGEMEGDLVATWEQPDDLTYIMHLRDDVTWDERAPTSGRGLEAEDVVLSWERWAEVGRRRTLLSNAVRDSAPITSFTAVDGKTLEIKLAFPDSTVLQALSWQNRLWVTPREAFTGAYDFETDMRGTGPFMLTDERSGVSVTFARNPKWHGNPGGPWLDGVEVTYIPEPAQHEAQFRAGNIHHGVGSFANIPIVAAEMEDSQLVKFPPAGVGGAVSLTWLPGSPFHDQRVRRAMSMAIERDVVIDIFSNPADYAPLGVELNSFWYNPTSPAYGPFWLDPQGSEFGPAAKYLEHNIAESKALLDAAGFTSENPLEFDVTQHPRSQENRAEVYQAMWADAGIKAAVTPADYASEWQEFLSAGRGYVPWHDGRYHVLLKPNSADPDMLIWINRFFSQAGSAIAGDEFPELERQIQAARSILDFDERVDALHDIQRYMVDEMVAVPYDARTETVEIYNAGVNGPAQWTPWQGAQNYGAASSTLAKHYWLDESLRG
jgi:peptide/nickel transport system substrate-binding protein